MNIQIKTATGYKDFLGVRKVVRNTTCKVQFESGRSLRCTTDHRVLLHNKFFIEAKFLSPGDVIAAAGGTDIVHEVSFKSTPGHVFYDALHVEGGFNYITNGVVSHNCQFLGSSGTLITGSKLKALVVEDDEYNDKKGLKIYESPLPNNIYVIVADVSRGKGLDYSAFSVIDISQMPYKQVATYRSNMILPTDYTSVLSHIGIHYNEAYILVENNDIGGQVADLLHMDYEYENILYTANNGRNGKILSSGLGSFGKAERGIRTTKNVKSLGCSMLKMLIEQDQLLVCDYDTIHELSTFSKKGTSYEAEPGCHDDMVMGLVLFAWMSSQKFFKNLNDVDTMSKLREETEEQIYDRLTPFGIVDSGVDYFDGSSIQDLFIGNDF